MIYMQQIKHGKQMKTNPSIEYIKKMSNVIESSNCWEWGGSKDKDGYGLMHVCKKLKRVHRVSYEVNSGEPIPNGIWVLHKCDNPGCCNPAHLFLGTSRDNINDCIKKKRWVYGDANGKSKLNWYKVNQIRKRYAAGEATQTKLSKEYGVSQTVIHNILKFKSWHTVRDASACFKKVASNPKVTHAV
jgi:hypothetical protein